MRLGKRYKSLAEDVRILFRILRHPHTPWRARLIACGVVGYVFSPLQLIPTFIPVIGQMDDVLLIYVGMKAMRAIVPRAILTECHRRA